MRTRIGKETLSGGAADSRAAAGAAALTQCDAAAPPRRPSLGQLKGREKLVRGGRNESISTAAADSFEFRPRRGLELREGYRIGTSQARRTVYLQSRAEGSY